MKQGLIYSVGSDSTFSYSTFKSSTSAYSLPSMPKLLCWNFFFCYYSCLSSDGDFLFTFFILMLIFEVFF